MRILGVDPGLNITGYGILSGEDDSISVVEAGVIRAGNKAPMAERLQHIARETESIISQFQPEAVAVEELYSHYGHPKTAIIMGHARGVIFLKSAEAGLPVFPYASTRIKKSLTGNGRASKRQMQLMIASTLGLSEIPEPPDVADALAVALCHCRALMHDNPMVTV
ncbi:MAG: crossover junction endodeoxyribonuclease RuvC [candidate division Zixibacteria bacterium]|nr:crossover junction endodeoxyribonuclease RuvC [candidate division Zixibacteria bacterium]MDH3938239.1 crossover junction endodeoxyribonuclease RuvC [candidate division Zixibacteria bacterium]MDH4034392.1 crossover junction endodeoxyribonuclease RuvC [candidate division Zixibacteria bacterium]